MTTMQRRQSFTLSPAGSGKTRTRRAASAPAYRRCAELAAAESLVAYCAQLGTSELEIEDDIRRCRLSADVAVVAVSRHRHVATSGTADLGGVSFAKRPAAPTISAQISVGAADYHNVSTLSSTGGMHLPPSCCVPKCNCTPGSIRLAATQFQALFGT